MQSEIEKNIKKLYTINRDRIEYDLLNTIAYFYVLKTLNKNLLLNYLFSFL